MIQQSGVMLEHYCTLTIRNLRIQAAQAESARAAAQRLVEANWTLLQASMITSTGFLVGFVLPYYPKRTEQQPALRPSSQKSIEESEFLKAANTVVRDHEQALRELSKH